MPPLTVGECARELGVRPKDLSDVLYLRILPDSDTECPVVAGRRYIPREYVPKLKAVLQERGKIRRREVAGS